MNLIKDCQLSIKHKRFLLGALFSLLLLFLCCVEATYAEFLGDDLWRVRTTQSETINAHGVCKKVTNNGNNDILVPTKTATEWSKFRDFAPEGISFGECYTYAWKSGECPVVCGDGPVDVWCERDDGQRVGDENCGSGKPSTTCHPIDCCSQCPGRVYNGIADDCGRILQVYCFSAGHGCTAYCQDGPIGWAMQCGCTPNEQYGCNEVCYNDLPATETNCANGVDDDLDQRADCADSDCKHTEACSERRWDW